MTVYSLKKELTRKPMAVYIQIGDVDNDQLIELPCENDGRLLLSTIAGQIPGAIGLKYKSESGSWRGLRISVST